MIIWRRTKPTRVKPERYHLPSQYALSDRVLCGKRINLRDWERIDVDAPPADVPLCGKCKERDERRR